MELKYIRYIIFLCGTLMLNCSHKNCEDSAAQNQEKMISDGYEKVTLVQTKDSNCSYLFTNSEGQSMDPINLASFKVDIKNKQKALVKYRMLRRASKCPNTIPVQLEYFELVK